MHTNIHHISAVSSNLQRTISFYTNLLGLRVIHKKRPFGGPRVCHFYWHEEVESFFTFYHCPNLKRGQLGAGAVQTVSFSVPASSFPFWFARLRRNGIAFSQMHDYLHNAKVFLFEDPDGLPIKLVFALKDCRSGFQQGAIPANLSVRGFYGVEISSAFAERLQSLFGLQFGLRFSETYSRCLRFSVQQIPGTFIDVYQCEKDSQCKSGSGMVHHLALRVHDYEAYQRIVAFYKEKGEGFIHRTQANSFSSLYFWEEEGMLFEAVGMFRYKTELRAMNHFPAGTFAVKKYNNAAPVLRESILQIRR